MKTRNWLVEFEKAISEPSRAERALRKLEEGGMVRIAFDDGVEVLLWQDGDRCLYQVWKGRLVRKGEVTLEFAKLVFYWLELVFESWRIHV